MNPYRPGTLPCFLRTGKGLGGVQRHPHSLGEFSTEFFGPQSLRGAGQKVLTSLDPDPVCSLRDEHRARHNQQVSESKQVLEQPWISL